jgi:hypothetical protein
MTEIRLAQYFYLVTSTGTRHRYQNFFVNAKPLATLTEEDGETYKYNFAPFRAEGSTANLNGDNGMLRVLFPNVEFAIRLVEQGDGNRLSELTLTTQWLNADLSAIAHLPGAICGHWRQLLRYYNRAAVSHRHGLCWCNISRPHSHP